MFVLERFKENVPNKEIIKKVKNIHSSILSIVNYLSIVYYTLFKRTELLDLAIVNMQSNFDNRIAHFRDELGYLSEINQIWLNWKKSKKLKVNEDLKTSIESISVLLDIVAEMPFKDKENSEIDTPPDMKIDESTLKNLEKAMDSELKTTENSERIANLEKEKQKAQDAKDALNKEKEALSKERDKLQAERAKAEKELKEALETVRELTKTNPNGDYSTIKETYDNNANKGAKDVLEDGLKKLVGMDTAGNGIVGAATATTNTFAGTAVQNTNAGKALVETIINFVKDGGNLSEATQNIIKNSLGTNAIDIAKGLGKGIVVSVISNIAEAYGDKERNKRASEDISTAYEKVYDYLKKNPGDYKGAQKVADDAIVEVHHQRDVEANTKAGTPGLVRGTDALREEAKSELNLESSDSLIGTLWSKIKGTESDNEAAYNDIIDKIVDGAQNQIDLENTAANIQGAKERLDKLKEELKDNENKLNEINTKQEVLEKEYKDIEQKSVNDTYSSVTDTLIEQGIIPTEEPSNYDSNYHPGDSGSKVDQTVKEEAQKKWDTMREKMNQYGIDPGDMPEDFY